ncbi:ATP-binding protein [Aeromicrobium yanjiei]|uniref:ATP-binding protein n=1 Tax=Aeromicrobium yanjiei TaxID=2662028 RepID=UPI001892BC7F|nr:ATP-binding protein [Aeromicrobium yanjiei]
MSARDYLKGFLIQLGEHWGPTSGVDALRTWNWFRLVTELAALEVGQVIDKRRSWTSAYEFAFKCVPDDDDLLEYLLDQALDDFAASDPASSRAWCAYTARIVAAVGHQQALAIYTNEQKAKLREAWLSQFGLNPDDSRNTVSMATSFAPRLKEATQKLYISVRDRSDSARALREASFQLSKFLDENESGLLSEVLDLAQDAQRLIAAESVNHRDLGDLVAALAGTKEAIAGSGSALLQDYVGPHVEAMMATAQRATAHLGDISRPEVTVRLSSAKVPFSAAVGSVYQVRFIAKNLGNTTAESILLRVVHDSLGIDSTSRLDSLGPGAETEMEVSVKATGSSPGTASLTCHLSWSDALLQQFTATQQLSAEDQMPVSWAPQDVNPFSLGTISEPERLVGRADDLVSLDALIAGRASAYITGQKRVGKTSLTRVLLKSVGDTRGWAGGLLSLGRALGEEQTAGDLVYALLDEILSAAKDAYGDAVDSVAEILIDDSGNFARAANRWIKGVARALPPGARVVVAIDDFDELPSHLVEGPQADALFLFLRSLVDEPWLNLIVVGSEVLPSIIQAQAHKLNQVVPVSVTNFASRESTAELLVSPTADRLEWGHESVDRVHYLCRGNPYYETLVAQRLWQTMRERARSIVTAADVDEATATVAREAPDSHFIHLWADSSTGLDHTARPAVVASAVMRSVARCGGSDLAPAATDEVVRIAGNWIQTATTTELHKAIASLKSRGVLESGTSDGSLLIRIPLVGIWLNDAGGRALDGLYASSKHATATSRMVTDSDLVALSKQLIYRGEHVTEIRIRAWLEQFGDNYHQYLAFKMLRRMIMDGYFTSTKLQSTVLPRLAGNVAKLGAARHFIREANNQNLKNAYLVAHGVPGDSTQGTLSILAKALKIKKANIVPTDQIAERVRSLGSGVILFLLDDYCGSGTHLSKELEKLLALVASLGDEWTERVTIVVGAGVVADASDLPRSSSAVAVESVGGVFLGERFRPFSHGSGVFTNEKEQQDAQEMLSSIGRALMPNNPLGFGGSSLLTLFEFNCPNNVAPVFWKAGSVSGSPWVPLFERMV